MKVHPYAELFPPIDEAALKKLADDIAKNGQQQPISTLEGKILDGRNRWNACQIAKVEPRTVPYEGDVPLSFVISLNLHRRQLSPSQLAIIGVEIEAQRAQEAERQRADKCRSFASRRPRDALGRLSSIVDQLPQKAGDPGRTPVTADPPDHRSGSRSSRASGSLDRPRLSTRSSESARQAARAVGVNHDYVSKAKRIARSAPELVSLIKSGLLKLGDAARLAKLSQAQRAQILSRPQDLQNVKAAIARMQSKSESAPDGTQAWVASNELSVLRDCFAKVLTGYLQYGCVELESLAECVSDLLAQIEDARQARSANHSARSEAHRAPC